MDVLSSFVNTFLNLLGAAAPWILLSFLSAAFFNQIGSLGWIKRKLHGDGMLPHVYATVAGVLTPA